MTQHTKEPWIAEGSRIYPEDIGAKHFMQEHQSHKHTDLTRANARRAAACVNFLEGIPTEALEFANSCRLPLLKWLKSSAEFDQDPRYKEAVTLVFGNQFLMDVGALPQEDK